MGIILVLYGIVATWQTANFGRVYATYRGGIVLGLIWAWKVDGFKPDKYDIRCISCFDRSLYHNICSTND
ncbi:hypothetical protein [Pedobacter sp.]|uniref:hypothetical protein n=1 Tax=Pedobacter sp. TaxID=1411316 RepID=UPI003D7FB900